MSKCVELAQGLPQQLWSYWRRLRAEIAARPSVQPPLRTHTNGQQRMAISRNKMRCQCIRAEEQGRGKYQQENSWFTPTATDS